MKKIIRRIGDSSGIIFNREERNIYDFNINDVIEVVIKKIKK